VKTLLLASDDDFLLDILPSGPVIALQALASALLVVGQLSDVEHLERQAISPPTRAIASAARRAWKNKQNPTRQRNLS
jgi:hypothetical protein